MIAKQVYTRFSLLCVAILFAVPSFATLHISECMADNDNTLLDIDGDSSDWIELHNDADDAVNLSGWYLTDTATNLTRWALPATTISANGYLLVFASGKDRAVAGEQLHTDFKLSASGEYVALTQPDGITLESEFSFPEQLEDVSWGYGFSGGSSTSTVTLVAEHAACTARIPTHSADATGWQQVGFNDSGWLSGSTGVGYERVDTGYTSLIGIDVSSMDGGNPAVYIRVPFLHDASNSVDQLLLRMKFDDGFVAYLNGTQVGSFNAPTPLAWNSEATGSHVDAEAKVFHDFDISSYASELLDGTNVLAILGINRAVTNSDALFLPKLNMKSIDLGASVIDLSSRGMLDVPTPGRPNGSISYAGYCEPPTVRPERGFYDAPFQVFITNNTAGATVRYTTDGSTPTESNGILYTGPIMVDGTKLLRATAVKPGYKPSAPNTQTYLFIADVLKQDGSGLQPYASWGDQDQNDWAVDPSMTNSLTTDMDGQSFKLADALLDAPTVSLVTDWDNWWSDAPGPALPNGVVPWQGIYADTVAMHADRRPVSMEFFSADGTEMFAENGRVSVVGGGIGGSSAKRWKSDKLSMRVSFDKKLKYPIFGNDAAHKFNGLFLDAHLAWCWTHKTMPHIGATPKFVSDAFASDLQNHMGNGRGAPHSRFVHLYLNGLYWGMYDMHERPDEHFSAEYYGGDNEDYDSVKHLYDDTVETDHDFDGDPYNDNITGGDDASLHAMFALARTDLSQPANYTALAEMLHIEDYIDYMLMNFYVGNTDWAHKNWYATYNRNDPDGRWRYHSWDAEHIMETSLFDANLAGARAYDATEGDSKDVAGDPMEIHLDLTAESAEYRMLFADRVHRHLFNDGILTITNSIAAFWERVKEIDRAMLGEAARWADNKAYKGEQYSNYDYSNWYNHMVDLRDNYFPQRHGIVLNQLRARNLYPNTSAPKFEVDGLVQYGGLVSPANLVRIDSTYPVYYTTDGSDPRAMGGAIAGQVYSQPLSFSKPTLLKARAKNGSEWSALCEAVFWTDEIPLAVTELMYHAPSNQLDFIEIQNISDEAVNLLGYKLDSAIDFHFRDSATPTLAPGEFLVAFKDVDQFSSQYSTNGILMAGEYKGDFDNGSEKVELEFWNKDLIAFRYSDARNWPQAADGAGHSLVPLDSALDGEEHGSLNYGGNWRASTYIGGSPGYADAEVNSGVMINEITAHTDTGDKAPFESNDQIELYNPTASDVVLNGWYLSDNLNEPNKWAIPNGTVVPAYGFALFDENNFHPDRVAGFGLDKAGEEVILSAPGRVMDSVRFKGQLNGASLGRYPDGENHWLTTTPTPGLANQLMAESVWINELMYNPSTPAGFADGDAMEYIQLENRSDGTVLFETAAGSWRINGGVSYRFPAGFSLSAHEKVWLVSFDPANTALLNLFCTIYGLNVAEETFLGPYNGQLSNQGERVALEQPQDSDDPQNPLDISWVVVDELFYFDQSPWPDGADGTGFPLIRTGIVEWGAPSATDADADQLQDVWENSYFSSLNEQPEGDWDMDGFNNLEEQICGTNPTNDQSYFAITNLIAPTLEWPAVSGRSYSVYWTDDLQQPFSRIASGLSNPSYTHSNHSTNAGNYYYITVEMK